VLPEHHDDHMPPRDKSQPTKEEIELIKTWILHRLPFDKSIRELGLPQTLFKSFFPKKPDKDYPNIKIEAASRDAIKSVKQQGIHVQQISKSSNFLSVSCINKPDFQDKDFQELTSIGKQIVVLDLGDTQVTDAIFKNLATLPFLTVLKIDNTGITGQHIGELKELQYLKVLNMAGTRFQNEYLDQLTTFKELRSVYLFNTGLIPEKSMNGGGDSLLTIEYGNYELPVLPTDSIIY
jgi:hypothetical protein